MRAAVFIALGIAVAVALSSGAQDGDVARGEQSYDAQDLRLVRVVGVVEIQTGGVDRISVDYDPGEGLLDAPRFEVDGDRLEITQLRRRDDVDCRSSNDEVSVRVENSGFDPIEDYGRWRIRVPAGARVDVGGGAVVATIGDVGELRLGVTCGDIAAGDVADDASIAVNGSSDVRIGAVGGKLEVAINGSGDVVAGAAANGLDAAINGSGDIEIASFSGGDVHAAINGSGDIRVLGGEADGIDASIMGSGDVRFGGVAGRVNLAAFGSGDIYVDSVTGPVRSSAFGSGRVRIGQD